MNHQHEPVFLYIEDDSNSRIVIDILIKRILGYQHLSIFEDSRNFEGRIAQCNPKPNVIFLDIQVSPYDGYQMLEILRKHPDYSSATIIAMTANVMSHDVERLKKVGFSGLIGKPIDRQIFPQLIARILAGDSVWYVP